MSKEEIKKIIEDFLSKTTFHIDRIDTQINDDDGSLWFVVRSNDSNLFIGKNGETLEAFNHILRKIIENKIKDTPLPYSIILDVNEYQKKKTENIKQVAHMMAERARFYKASVAIDPMNAFERRIIHTFLEKHKDLKTESEGFGPTRHVVIKYIGEISGEMSNI